MPNEQQMNVAVVERLKLAQPKLSKLAPEMQQKIYGTIFDSYLKPQYAHLKLADADLESAKSQWIQRAQGGKPEPLPENFGVDKTTPSTGKKIAAGLEAGGAGVLGGVRNLSEFVSKYDKSDLSKDPIHKALSDVEHRAYEDALAIDPTIASRSAGGGHILASQMAYEAGAAYGGASRLGRAAFGAATSAPVSGASGALDVGLQTATNVAIDAILGGIGKVGARGVGTFMGKIKTSKNPATIEAVKQIETVGKQAADTHFNGKAIKDLSASELDAWKNHVDAGIKAGQVKANEASKAVKEAAKAQKPTRDELIVEAAKKRLADKQARKAASDASMAFQKKVTQYAKRTGKVPEGEHLEALKGAATVDSLLGEQAKKVEKTIAQVTNEAEAKTLQEGSPQTLEAVQALKDISPVADKIEKAAKAKKEPFFKTDVSEIIGAKSVEEFGRAKKDALVALKTEAQQRSKAIKSSAEGIKINTELKKEEARINSIPVPESIGGRKLAERTRKVAEKSGQVGMEVAEAEQGQKAKTIGLKAEQQMGDPSSGLIDALDAQKGLLATIEGMVGAEKLKRVKLAVQHDPIEIQNDKLQKFINLQPKVAAKQ